MLLRISMHVCVSLRERRKATKEPDKLEVRDRAQRKPARPFASYLR